MGKHLDSELIIKLYLYDELRLAQLGEKFNVSYSKINDILQQESVEKFKVCSTCNKRKHVYKFPKDKNKSCYRGSQCKDCKNGLRRKTDGNKKGLVKDGRKYCIHCKDWFDLEGKHWYAKGRACKKKHKERVVKQVKNNPEKHYGYIKKWLDKKEKQLGVKYHKFRTQNMVDSYIAMLLRYRVNANSKFYQDDWESHKELFEKQREKLKLEKEIKREIIN